MNLKQHPVISSVNLLVENLQSTMKFYIDVLGFKVLKETETEATLTADGKTPILTLQQPSDIQKRKRSTGLYHIAFLLPNRSDLADIIHYFIKTQYPLQGASDHHVSEALYLADPEGNGIEIYIDRPTDQWKWDDGQVHMTTVALDIESILREASTEGWKGMPEQTLVGHIHLQVNELQKTKQFYCDLLGFEPVLNYGSQALFISKHRYHHHIGMNTWGSAGAPAPAENSAGLKWFTILVPDEKELQAVKDRLQAAGEYIAEEQGSFITKDPAGIRVRLLVK